MVMAVGRRRAAGRKPTILPENKEKDNCFLCSFDFQALLVPMRSDSCPDTVIAAPSVILIGPTAAGKTALSLELAHRFDAEIVSLDSMQVYRHMDIGTAKATAEERQQVPHHLLDLVSPDEEYHAARYVRDAAEACREITARGKLPLLVGGTGLYLKALQEGLFAIPAHDEALRSELRERLARQGRAALFAELAARDPASAARIHANDTHRLLRALEILESTGMTWGEHLSRQKPRPLLARALKIGLRHERPLLYERINLRVRQMVDLGLLAEVEKLTEMGYGSGLKPMQAIGYRHMLHFLASEWSWDETLALLARDTRRYAKRQLTWFSGDKDIHWLEPAKRQAFFDLVAAFLDAA